MNTIALSKKAAVGLLLTLLSQGAQAYTKVCAGPTLHYSVVIFDRGTAPLPGEFLGTEFLSRRGKLLGERQLYQDDGVGFWPFALKFGVNIPQTSETTDQGSWKIYSAVMQVDLDAGGTYHEAVTCREDVHYVP